MNSSRFVFHVHCGVTEKCDLCGEEGDKYFCCDGKRECCKQGLCDRNVCGTCVEKHHLDTSGSYFHCGQADCKWE